MRTLYKMRKKSMITLFIEKIQNSKKKIGKPVQKIDKRYKLKMYKINVNNK